MSEFVFLDEVYQRSDWGQPVLFLRDCEWVIQSHTVTQEEAEAMLDVPDYGVGKIEVVSWLTQPPQP